MTGQTINSHSHVNNAGLSALLTFSLAGQLYGLPVTNVARIIEMVALTYLPGAPETIVGLLNVQGKVVPVIDLRLRFGLPRQPYSLQTPIIIINLADTGRTLALIVDSVEQVVEIPSHQLAPTEAIIPAEMAAPAAFLTGVATIEQKLILALNITEILTLKEHNILLQALGNHDEIQQQADRRAES